MEPDAKKIARAIRARWAIENSLHWVLDVTFHEDKSRIRKDHAPENIAILRHFAINLLKKDSEKRSIKSKRLKAGWNNEYLEKILLQA
jgi:predicted transposase YbfD/YdcC